MFRLLRYINEVYKEKSFSKAAQNLFIAQPSLSLSIKKHETEIGIQIFDRSTSPIQLTEAGEVYMEGVRRILEIQNDLGAYLDDYRELRTGTLVLAAPHFFSSYFLPTLITPFSRKYPNVKIRLVEGDYLSLHERTLSGEVDLLVESAEFDQELFRSHTLLSERVLLAVPEEDAVNETLKKYALDRDDVCSGRHGKADFPCVPLHAFHQHRFLMLEKGHDMWLRSMRLCRNSGFEPDVFMSLNQLMTVYNLTEQQLGVSFVTDTIVKLSDKGKNVVFYKIEGEQAIRNVNLAHKRNRYLSRPVREFVKLVLGSDRK